jgi:prepilin-type processing-associated H-X9-DG protein
MARRSGSTFQFVASPAEGKLLNNGFWGSPGSAHPGGASFGLADGSVTFVSDLIDPNVFALLGSMAGPPGVNYQTENERSVDP